MSASPAYSTAARTGTPVATLNYACTQLMTPFHVMCNAYMWFANEQDSLSIQASYIE